jgi:hypothetical protein
MEEGNEMRMSQRCASDACISEWMMLMMRMDVFRDSICIDTHAASLSGFSRVYLPHIDK